MNAKMATTTYTLAMDAKIATAIQLVALIRRVNNTLANVIVNQA